MFYISPSHPMIISKILKCSDFIIKENIIIVCVVFKDIFLVQDKIAVYVSIDDLFQTML